MNALTSGQVLTANHIQWTRYIQVASLTLVLHDYLLTLQQEVDLVWRGAHARSWPRLLFFAARYACPIALIINTVALLDTHTSKERPFSLGQAWLAFHGWSAYAFFVGVQVISHVRLWVMYRSTKVLFVMTIFVALALAAMGVIEGSGYSGVLATTEYVRNLVHICGPGTQLPHYVYAFWLPPLVVESISVTLVLYKARLYFQGAAPSEWPGSRFMRSLIHYSIFYFVVVLVVYLTNFYVWLRLPISAFELFIPLTYALPSIAGNRMLLSLRGVFYADNVLPEKDGAVSLPVIQPDRRLTVYSHNPLHEFDSFGGNHP